MNIGACLSHNSDEWTTPLNLFEDLNKEFNFDVDLASSNKNCLCSKFETIDSNPNLTAIYNNKNIFCNPPYSKLKSFIKYCYDLAFIHHNIVVMLIPARTDTIAFHTYIYMKDNVEIRFIKGRLHFSNKGSAPFPSMIVVFKGK